MAPAADGRLSGALHAGRGGPLHAGRGQGESEPGGRKYPLLAEDSLRIDSTWSLRTVSWLSSSSADHASARWTWWSPPSSARRPLCPLWALQTSSIAKSSRSLHDWAGLTADRVAAAPAAWSARLANRADFSDCRLLLKSGPPSAAAKEEFLLPGELQLSELGGKKLHPARWTAIGAIVRAHRSTLTSPPSAIGGSRLPPGLVRSFAPPVGCRGVRLASWTEPEEGLR